MSGSPTPLIAGNWKMHGSNAFAADLAGELADRMSDQGAAGFEMLLCPPALLIGTVQATVGASGIAVGGQDCHTGEQGAHTGDIAAAMLADAGCRYVIVGHSERRADHGEDDSLVRAKAAAAHSASSLKFSSRLFAISMASSSCIRATLSSLEHWKWRKAQM